MGRKLIGASAGSACSGGGHASPWGGRQQAPQRDCAQGPASGDQLPGAEAWPLPLLPWDADVFPAEFRSKHREETLPRKTATW